MYHIIVLTVLNENHVNEILTANPVEDAEWLKVEITSHPRSDVRKHMIITFKSATNHAEIVRQYAALLDTPVVDEHGFIDPVNRRAQYTEGVIMPMIETIGPDDEGWHDNTHETFEQHDGFYRLSEYIRHCPVHA